MSYIPSKTTPYNNIVELNGSRYVSKNGKLVRLDDSNLSTPSSSTSSISNTPLPPASSHATTPDKYIKTKNGSLVRVGSNPKFSDSQPKTPPRAKVNNKEILLNPRIMPNCPQFTLTGKCVKRGNCLYARHDRAHLALCKQFLMRGGECKRGNRCLLSHTPNDHNLPTCTYFLENKCSCTYGRGHLGNKSELAESSSSSSSKPVECRFAHPPKLAFGTLENKERKLCREFAYTGYCTLGSQQCPYVHSYHCPDFVETGACSERKCRLMHVNDGYHVHDQPSIPVVKDTKEDNKEVDMAELARSMYTDSDSDEGDEVTMPTKNETSKDEAMESSSGNSEDSDDEEFNRFWQRRSSLKKEDDGFSKNDDFITF